MFMIALGDSGAGKTPCFNHGCQKPVALTVAPADEGGDILVDDFTDYGIFMMCL